MISPFDFSESSIFLQELNGSDDIVVVLKRSATAFGDAYERADEKHTLVPLRTCTDFWVSACLLDAVLNGTDYSDGESSSDAAFRKAIEKLKTAFARKRFISGKPYYDIEAVKDTVYTELTVFGIGDNSELFNKLTEKGKSEEFSDMVTGLMNRLIPNGKK